MCSPNGTVSAFANIIEPNQRLFNKNNFAFVSGSGLMAAGRFIHNFIFVGKFGDYL